MSAPFTFMFTGGNYYATQQSYNFFHNDFSRYALPAASAAISTVLTGNPVAGMAAFSSAAALNTGTGRKITRQVGSEFFDDVLGMRPKTAQIWSAVALSTVMTLGLESFYANLMYDPLKTAPYDAEKHFVDQGGSRQGAMFGPTPKDGRFSADQLSALVDENGNQVGILGVDRVGALRLDKELSFLGINHSGVNMVGVSDNFLNPFSYLSWGVCHQSTNLSILQAGYSSTLTSLGQGGWSTYLSTAVYGNYGTGAFQKGITAIYENNRN